MDEYGRIVPDEAVKFRAPETEDQLDPLPIEVIGEDPRQLSREEFNQHAWLYHAARNPEFSVNSQFDYAQDITDGATLGNGLYTTTNWERANQYANLRPNASISKLLPNEARMLNLTDSEKLENRSVPKELVNEWVSFAEPRIRARLEDAGNSWVAQKRLQEVLNRTNSLTTKARVDLRDDILDTLQNPFSVVEDLWREFCESKNLDGVIYVEGGEEKFADQMDRTYVFYNLNKIGTYEDWQKRHQEETNE